MPPVPAPFERPPLRGAEPLDRELHAGADADREDDGADAHRPAEQVAGDEHAELDAGADEA